jgi:hypothetical protein
MNQLGFIDRFSPFIYNDKKIKISKSSPHMAHHLRTWTRHEIAIQSGHKSFLVLMRRDNRDIFTFFPRKSLRLVLQSLRKRIAPDGIHKATMNLLSFFVNAEQQPKEMTKNPPS